MWTQTNPLLCQPLRWPLHPAAGSPALVFCPFSSVSTVGTMILIASISVAFCSVLSSASAGKRHGRRAAARINHVDHVFKAGWACWRKHCPRAAQQQRGAYYENWFPAHEHLL
jgi:hypothetical protein